MNALVGHVDQAGTMLAAARSGRMHHGWILAGPRGIGKATFARAMAMQLLAEAAGESTDDAGLGVPLDSPTRKLIAAEAHPDYAELYCLEKESGTARNITVDQVRGLQRLIQSAPTFSDRRVVVIDSADDLERGAANALLKSLEEPPPGMLFLLVSHAPGRLLPTIRSRCRTLRFDPLDDDAVRAVLRAQDPAIAPDEIEPLVRAGKGAPGRALRFAGLDIADIERMLVSMAAGGDPGNRQRLILAKALSNKTARPRYEAFLERVPAFIAETARKRSGPELGEAIEHWEAARKLAGGAIILSLEPGSVAFELAGHVAALAPRQP